MPDLLTAARIGHLFISPGHNFFGHHGREPDDHPMREVASVQCVAGRGLVGDRYYDFKADYKGQVTFFSLEVYEDLCRRFNHRPPPSVFRRNVLVEGIDLNARIGHTFELQGVRFEGVEECRPCYWMNRAFGPGAEAALQGRGGLRARILSDGVLRSSAP
jgi:MOSC domain-containing protein YiiM